MMTAFVISQGLRRRRGRGAVRLLFTKKQVRGLAGAALVVMSAVRGLGVSVALTPPHAHARRAGQPTNLWLSASRWFSPRSMQTPAPTAADGDRVLSIVAARAFPPRRGPAYTPGSIPRTPPDPESHDGLVFRRPPRNKQRHNPGTPDSYQRHGSDWTFNFAFSGTPPPGCGQPERASDKLPRSPRRMHARGLSSLKSRCTRTRDGRDVGLAYDILRCRPSGSSRCRRLYGARCTPP